MANWVNSQEGYVYIGAHSCYADQKFQTEQRGSFFHLAVVGGGYSTAPQGKSQIPKAAAFDFAAR
jgi:hypothetical protein